MGQASVSPLVNEVIDDEESFAKVKERAKLLGWGQTGLVLVSTGSYAPVHLMHLKVDLSILSLTNQIMEEAKNHLEESGFVVLGGFMSPSHDSYVSRKMLEAGSFHIPGEHRVAMCELACENSDWLATTAWESKRAKFSYINETVEYIHLRISQLMHGLSFQVVYVAGIDTITKCDMYWGITHEYGKAPVIGVGRSGYDHSQEIRMKAMYANEKLPLFDFVEKQMDDHSSTRVREEVMKGNSVLHLCGEKIDDYFRDKELYSLTRDRKKKEEMI